MTNDRETIELIVSVKNGSNDAFEKLVSKYRKVIESSVRSFSKKGEGDGCSSGSLEDDLRQEARLALYRAAESYDAENYGDAVTFGLYCKICITNALISEKRRRIRAERKAEKLKEEMRRRVYPSTGDGNMSSDENKKALDEILRLSEGVLSAYELQILKHMISGKPVREISLSVGRNEKSVSNAIYRIKIKLRGLTN